MCRHTEFHCNFLYFQEKVIVLKKSHLVTIELEQSLQATCQTLIAQVTTRQFISSSNVCFFILCSGTNWLEYHNYSKLFKLGSHCNALQPDFLLYYHTAQFTATLIPRILYKPCVISHTEKQPLIQRSYPIPNIFV